MSKRGSGSGGEISRRGRNVSTLLAACAMWSASAGAVLAANDEAAGAADVSNKALLKKLEAMERRIKLLEGELKDKATAERTGGNRADRAANGAAKPGASGASGTPAARPNDASAEALATPAPAEPADKGKKAILGLVDSPVPGLVMGAYGEAKFGAFQNPAAGGEWQNGFDLHRLVLLPTYQITPNIIFNAEIEYEHGGLAFDADDKRHGSVTVEQLWVDFKIVDEFNWRAPGVDLVPIGYINQHHEPTLFYSVKRPELYNGLIPSTFMAPATSVYGRIAEGFSYQVQVSSSLEDFGDNFDKRTEANRVVPFPVGYAPGISGLDALALARPVIGDFRQLNDQMAYAGRFDIAPPFFPGFAGSVSAYYSPNVTPRGAYADTGDPLGRTSLAIFDGEFRYRLPNTGLELRGEAVRVQFGNPANLRANNDTDPTNNVGKYMYGYSGEVAYHIPLGALLNSEWEAVPFYRYTRENLQTSGFVGTDANTPTGAGQLQFHSVGLAVFPSPNLVLKATYQKIKNDTLEGARADSFLGAVGFFF